MMKPVNVVLSAGNLLLVIKTAGSVYSVPVCENVKRGAGRVQRDSDLKSQNSD